MTVLALKTDSIPWILFFHEWFIWLLGSQLVPWRPLVYRVHPHLHAWSLLWLCSLLLVWIGLYVLVCLLPDSWCSLEVLGAVCSLLSRLVVSLPKESLVYYSSFHLSEILTCGLSSFKQVPQFPRIRTQFPFSIFWLSGLGCFLAVDLFACTILGELWNGIVRLIHTLSFDIHFELLWLLRMFCTSMEKFYILVGLSGLSTSYLRELTSKLGSFSNVKSVRIRIYLFISQSEVLNDVFYILMGY